jgi:hypothetical protein
MNSVLCTELSKQNEVTPTSSSIIIYNQNPLQQVTVF